MTAVDTPAPGLVEAWLDNDALVGDKRILGAYAWRDNAELITAVARLHIVPRFGQDPHVVDATFGEGKWWTRWRPRRLVPHDRYKVDGVDYRALPEADDTYEVGTLDVPYVAIGGRETSTIHQFNHAYGLVDAPKNPAGVQADLQAGLAEVARVVAPKGLVVDDQGDEHLEPVPNVWIGTSVESTRYAWRARALVEVAAPVRFLSVEPMLGPVDVDLTGIDWVLLGGESGPGARPLDLGWMRDLIARSREAGTAVFVKQLGSRYGKQHHDPSTWPDDLRVQEWPTPRIRTGVQ